MVVVDQLLVVVVGAYIRPDPWPSAHNSPRELALNGHGTICPWHAGMRAWHDICFATVSGYLFRYRFGGPTLFRSKPEYDRVSSSHNKVQ